MTISKKMLIVFVLTIFVVSFGHCSDSFPGLGLKKQAHKQCYSPDLCTGGDSKCDICCVLISGVYYGKCIQSKCHCLIKTK
ncbi:Defensin-like protein 113 [Arabidopsis thaliana]|uniref:Uncharacterized protein n=3 Tax=Arabidopsis TaxID=3701 RepID=A0A654G4K1_ARATH|nr:hypothetical protein ISN45_At05g025970 [Arabidopsis thaliana x Arabidopsis arenosa]KAG7610578.1 hypothetical protein ISN44_As05g025740 [Arabidopsis suecica]CAA0405134.1 unnamed protein product [Arabidopsis thaliana]VYS68085.1 unnamed protein product [Arabidopsis thaliana]